MCWILVARGDFAAASAAWVVDDAMENNAMPLSVICYIFRYTQQIRIALWVRIVLLSFCIFEQRHIYT